MTKNACQFIQPLTFESLTKKISYIDTFERTTDGEVKHIELLKKQIYLSSSLQQQI